MLGLELSNLELLEATLVVSRPLHEPLPLIVARRAVTLHLRLLGHHAGAQEQRLKAPLRRSGTALVREDSIGRVPCHGAEKAGPRAAGRPLND